MKILCVTEAQTSMQKVNGSPLIHAVFPEINKINLFVFKKKYLLFQPKTLLKMTI